MVMVDNHVNYLLGVNLPFPLLCLIVGEPVNTFGTGVMTPVGVGGIHIVKTCRQVLCHAC